jgi:hypothetical protein
MSTTACLLAGWRPRRLTSGVSVNASPNDKLAHFADYKFERGLKWEETVHRPLLSGRGGMEGIFLIY